MAKRSLKDSQLVGEYDQPQGIAALNPKKDEKTNPFLLSQRQHLIQKLNDLLYKTQTKKVTDDQVSEILKRLSTI